MPVNPPMTMHQILTGGMVWSPLAMASATPFQVWAAGAGNWSVPSTEALGTSTRKAATVTRVPMKIPANCAISCFRGLAPRRYPLFRSVSRSAEEVADPAVMLAAIRFTFKFPGERAPKVSWVIFPMAPIGVVSVSPVTRQATSARKNDIPTAMTLCQIGMSKLTLASQHRAMRETT
jgi:hypothetical protein